MGFWKGAVGGGWLAGGAYFARTLRRALLRVYPWASGVPGGVQEGALPAPDALRLAAHAF